MSPARAELVLEIADLHTEIRRRGATVRAVEELARSDFARPEDDLAPGALAKEDADTAKLLECMRRDKGANRPVEAPSQAQSTSASRNPKPHRKPPKPKTSNPAPKTYNSGSATTPRGLIDEMARWQSAVGAK